MKLAVLVPLFAGLLAAGTLTARSRPQEWWSFAQSSMRRAEFASVSLAIEPLTSHEVEISVVLGLPYGCYRPDVGVEHRDEFTHVLRPVLLEDSIRCARPTSLDFQTVSLGYLSEGSHKVIVENVEQPSEPLMFRVVDGNKNLKLESGDWK